MLICCFWTLSLLPPLPSSSFIHFFHACCFFFLTRTWHFTWIPLNSLTGVRENFHSQWGGVKLDNVDDGREEKMKGISMGSWLLCEKWKRVKNSTGERISHFWGWFTLRESHNLKQDEELKFTCRLDSSLSWFN